MPPAGFPETPEVDDECTVDNVTRRWDGVHWKIVAQLPQLGSVTATWGTDGAPDADIVFPRWADSVDRTLVSFAVTLETASEAQLVVQLYKDGAGDMGSITLPIGETSLVLGEEDMGGALPAGEVLYPVITSTDGTGAVLGIIVRLS